MSKVINMSAPKRSRRDEAAELFATLTREDVIEAALGLFDELDGVATKHGTALAELERERDRLIEAIRMMAIMLSLRDIDGVRRSLSEFATLEFPKRV
jgi:ribosomal 50S subunit-associated protein YjgA (DUF615 family)